MLERLLYSLIALLLLGLCGLAMLLGILSALYLKRGVPADVNVLGSYFVVVSLPSMALFFLMALAAFSGLLLVLRRLR